MARYSLFVLKVPTPTDQPSIYKSLGFYCRERQCSSWAEDVVFALLVFWASLLLPVKRWICFASIKYEHSTILLAVVVTIRH